MAINVFGGRRNSIYAKYSMDISALGLTPNNARNIILIDSTIKSFVPGRVINSLTIIEAGKSYILFALVDMDLEQYFYPPFYAEWQENQW